MHPHAHSQFSPWQAPHDDPSTRSHRHVSDASMSMDDMAFHQKRSADGDIRELITQCRDRYCFAHELIRPHAILPDRLFDRDMLDLGCFVLPWSEFCSAYRRFLFSPQMGLFEDQRESELRRWRVFVEDECFARFARKPEWIRAVLETANLIPLRGPHRDTFVGDLFDDIIQDLQERNEFDHDE